MGTLVGVLIIGLFLYLMLSSDPFGWSAKEMIQKERDQQMKEFLERHDEK